MRDSPGRLDGEICWENIVATITEIVSKFKRNILKNYYPQILPKKVFFAQSLFFLTFLLSLFHYAHCSIHWSLVFKSTLYKFIVLGYLSMNSSAIWAQDPNPAPTIKLYNNQSFGHYHKNIQNKITHCNIT